MKLLACMDGDLLLGQEENVTIWSANIRWSKL